MAVKIQKTCLCGRGTFVRMVLVKKEDILFYGMYLLL